MKILSTSLLFLAVLVLPSSSPFAGTKQAAQSAPSWQYVGTTNYSTMAQQEALEFANEVNNNVALPPDTKAMPVLRPPVKGAGSKVVQHNAATPVGNNASQNAVTGLTRGFTGLRHLDSRLARGGNQFSITPPDQGLAVNAPFVVEAINCALAIYDTSGDIALSTTPVPGLTVYPVALTTFFGIQAAFNRSTGAIHNNPGDPVVLYDPETNRWFVEAWAQDVKPNGQGLGTSTSYLAVSTSGDPTGTWFQYQAHFIGIIPDYGKIGVDHNGIYLSYNAFQLQNFPPNGFFATNLVAAQILATNKSQLEANNPTPNFQFFSFPFNTGFEFTVMPQMAPPGTAYLNSNNGTAYFVSSQFVFNQECVLEVWAFTNTNSLANAVPNINVKTATVNTQCYNFPSQAVLQQPGFTPLGNSVAGSLEQLDPGDFRVGGQNIVFTNSQLFATLATEVTDSFGNQVMGGAWFVLHPSISGGTLTATVTAQGIVSLNGASFLRPAFAMNTQLFGGIVGTQVGTTNFPSAAFLGFNGFTPGSISILRAGNEPQDDFSGYGAFGGGGVARWGDYSAAVVDSDNSIWLATEYTPDINRTSLANWATYIARLQLNH